MSTTRQMIFGSLEGLKTMKQSSEMTTACRVVHISFDQNCPAIPGNLHHYLMYELYLEHVCVSQTSAVLKPLCNF